MNKQQKNERIAKYEEVINPSGYAILAEFDALPGLNQGAVASRQITKQDAAGHACGHHLFGAASTTAAVALAKWLDETGTPGTSISR